MTSNTDKKPSVLIIGGLGFIGRNVALYIHNNSLASHLRLVDKQIPSLARLPPSFPAILREPSHFCQADASRPDHVARIFAFPSSVVADISNETNDTNEANGSSNSTRPWSWDYVINCAADTSAAASQSEEISRARTTTLSTLMGREAQAHGVRAFVELSTGHVYKRSSSTAATEGTSNSSVRPRTPLAASKLDGEQALAGIAGLPLAVLRLAHVYGEYEVVWLGTALSLARVWQSEGGEMRWMGGRDVRTHTVHVEDVARACWQAAVWVAEKQRKGTATATAAAGEGYDRVFNVVDSGNTTQGMIGDILQEMFGIKVVYTGGLIGQLAKLALGNVVDSLNDDTLDIWAGLQEDANTDPNTPLTPFMEKEWLKGAELNLNGDLFRKTIGFEYNHPKVTKSEIEKVIESYKSMNWWP